MRNTELRTVITVTSEGKTETTKVNVARQTSVCGCKLTAWEEFLLSYVWTAEAEYAANIVVKDMIRGRALNIHEGMRERIINDRAEYYSLKRGIHTGTLTDNFFADMVSVAHLAIIENAIASGNITKYIDDIRKAAIDAVPSVRLFVRRERKTLTGSEVKSLYREDAETGEMINVAHEMRSVFSDAELWELSDSIESVLTKREKTALRLYAMGNTFETVGKRLSCSKENARFIVGKARAKILDLFADSDEKYMELSRKVGSVKDLATLRKIAARQAEIRDKAKKLEERVAVGVADSKKPVATYEKDFKGSAPAEPTDGQPKIDIDRYDKIRNTAESNMARFKNRKKPAKAIEK